MKNLLKKDSKYLIVSSGLFLLLLVCMVQFESESENVASPQNNVSTVSNITLQGEKPTIGKESFDIHMTKNNLKEKRSIENKSDVKNEKKYVDTIEDDKFIEEHNFKGPNVDAINNSSISIEKILNAYDAQSYEEAWYNLESNLDETTLLSLFRAYETEMDDKQRERTLFFLFNANSDELSNDKIQKMEEVILEEMSREDSNLLADVLEKLEDLVTTEIMDSE